MKKRLLTIHVLSCVSMAVLVLVHTSQAQNLFPDPGFEQSGVTGEAHSGHKAGCLKVGDRQRRVCPGGSLPAEPSAPTTTARG